MALIYCASLVSTPLILIVESIIKLAKNVMTYSSIFKEWMSNFFFECLDFTVFVWA